MLDGAVETSLTGSEVDLEEGGSFVGGSFGDVRVDWISVVSLVFVKGDFGIRVD